MYIILTVLILSWIEFILPLISRGVANISSGAADMEWSMEHSAINMVKLTHHGVDSSFFAILWAKNIFFKGAKKWSSNQINKIHLVYS